MEATTVCHQAIFVAVDIECVPVHGIRLLVACQVSKLASGHRRGVPREIVDVFLSVIAPVRPNGTTNELMLNLDMNAQHDLLGVY